MVGFTGTSDMVTKPQETTLRFVLTQLRKDGELWLNHGDCINADALAHRIWRDELDGRVCIHPPTDPKKRAFCEADMVLDPLPYLERNRNIAGMNNRLIACPKGLTEERRSGTWATIRYAREMRKNICIIFPNGNILEELSSRG